MPKPSLKNMVRRGYEQLAFGSVGDVVRLLMHSPDDPPLNLHKLDLFCVAELKRKDNSFEVKLVNRLEALDRLAALESAEQNGTSLFDALEKSARALEQSHE